MRMSHWSPEERARVIAELRRKSAVDPEFRSLALRDAAAALARITSTPLPADITYKFVDNSGSLKTIPLPDAAAATDELSDADLEKVAGGDFTGDAGWHG
jgi:hypothetical protein